VRETYDTVDEFVYLIDAMSHYQMLLSNKPIRVRFTNPGTDSANNFGSIWIPGSYLAG